jgi:hypothetical protein
MPLIKLSSGTESYNESQEKEDEDECAYASGDISMAYIECDVITKRNLSFYYSLLPPGSRL